MNWKRAKVFKKRKAKLRDKIVKIIGTILFIFMIGYFFYSVAYSIDKELEIEDRQINNFLTLQK